MQESLFYNKLIFFHFKDRFTLTNCIFWLPFKYFCFLFLLRFIFKNPAISAHFARSRQSPVHHTWIRQILARFTARVLSKAMPIDATHRYKYTVEFYRRNQRVDYKIPHMLHYLFRKRLSGPWKTKKWWCERIVWIWRESLLHLWSML